MDFIYRIPLFQFDPDQPEELTKNRDTILEMLKFSSPDFYHYLESRCFNNLDEKTLLKLKKYLIRGRYRPTPFGTLAGVGMGIWKDSFAIEMSQGESQLQKIFVSPPAEQIPNLESGKFYLMPGTFKKLGYYQSITYDQELQRWGIGKIVENKLFDLIYEKGDHALSFEEFSGWFGDRSDTEVSRMVWEFWNQVHRSGFLYPFKRQLTHFTSSTDTYVGNRIVLKESVKAKLENFVCEVGNLFVKESSSFLNEFKRWFRSKFDDRFVSLERLIQETGFISNPLFAGGAQILSEEIEPAGNILSETGEEEFDLAKNFAKKPLVDAIFDLQLLFRLDQSGNPIIDNIVCNRPFVYTGRFNRFEEVGAFSKKIKDKIFQDPSVLYANLKILETDSINHICEVNNIFDWEISPAPPCSERQLPYSQIYVGLGEDRVFLIHKETEKEIIPVVMHPLNGSEISHPIQRVLWEIAHQDRFRFLPYTDPNFKTSDRAPRYLWGDLCTQQRRWKIKKGEIGSAGALAEALTALEVPRIFMAGNFDRELLIDREKEREIEILWEELVRKEELILTEALWFPHPIFNDSGGISLYPQFVFQSSKPYVPAKGLPFYNPITEAGKDCLYLKIILSDHEFSETLEGLGEFLKRQKSKGNLQLWHFLIYSKDGVPEIRLRFFDTSKSKRSELLVLMAEFMEEEKLIWSTDEYFPELKKYGPNGVKTSEHLFYLESDFLLCQECSGRPNNQIDSKEKEDLIVWLWLEISMKYLNPKAFFQILKLMTKNSDWEIVNGFKVSFHYLEKPKDFGFPYRSYLEIFSIHEYLKKSEEVKTRLILNHLHMIVNRFFPENSFSIERGIWYRLYRELGRELYR